MSSARSNVRIGRFGPPVQVPTSTGNPAMLAEISKGTAVATTRVSQVPLFAQSGERVELQPNVDLLYVGSSNTWITGYPTLSPTVVTYEIAADWDQHVASHSCALQACSAVRERFYELNRAWDKARNTVLSGPANYLVPEYQQIVGLGPAILPELFALLEKGQTQWFWALRAITGQDPVKDEHVGDLQAMRADWLAWKESRNAGWHLDKQ